MRRTDPDAEVFERFYEATAPAIRAYILRHCGDRDAADDLLQITFIKFLGSRMGSTPQAASAKAYLYRIASNVIADHGRTLSSRARLEDSVRRAREHESVAPERDHLELRQALRTLSAREQQLLWLVYAEGFSHREVARIMNVSRASVKVLAFRARKKLAQRLNVSRAADQGSRP